MFTRQDAFAEYVQSAEGVPRDGINILSLAAQRANEGKISIPDVRYAARAWYQQGKESAVNADKGASDLLQWIIKEVIAAKRARAFLLSSGTRHKLIDSLFDSRVLHIIKRGVSTNDKPGVRYQVYKLDYGCYVDLLATAKAPEGLLPGKVSGSYLADVPSDDYRAIRRAILDLEQFEASRRVSR